MGTFHRIVTLTYLLRILLASVPGAAVAGEEGVAMSADDLRAEKRYNATELLDRLLHGYDRRLHPGFGGGPTRVDVNLNIRSIGPISEMDMTYQMDCYFRQSWEDRRLAFGSSTTTLPVNVNILHRIWKPDTHFINGQKSRIHIVTAPNTLLRISNNGRVLYSMRLTIIASCPMHLEDFPMDTQMCPLMFGSHGYSTKDMTYVWTRGPDKSIEIAADMTLSQFDLIAYPAGNTTIEHSSRGEFSVLYVNFALRRHTGYFLINIYVPCSLLVVLSWVGFWINREATSDRIALGITVVLTMTFIGLDNRVDIPRVPYATALDHFLAVCFILISAVIVESAAVNYFTKYSTCDTPSSDDETEDDYWSDNDKKSGSTRNSLARMDKSNGQPVVTLRLDGVVRQKSSDGCCNKLWHCLKGSHSYRRELRRRGDPGRTNSVSQLDTVSRIVFPFVFGIFQIIYWTLYFGSLKGNITSTRSTY